MKALLRVFVAIIAAVLFGAAGRVDLPFFWAVIAIAAVYVLVNLLVMDPALRHERLKPGAGGVSRSFRLMVLPIIVRHPGYVATVLVFFFATLALGSWLATALTVVYAAAFVYRTALEERFLRENLPGYVDYAAAVRARWVPGVW